MDILHLNLLFPIHTESDYRKKLQNLLIRSYLCVSSHFYKLQYLASTNNPNWSSKCRTRNQWEKTLCSLKSIV